MRFLGLFATFCVLACGVPENGPWMNPGQNCMLCHSAGGTAESRPWSAAGTVFDASGQGLMGTRITITDGEGREHVLTSNGAGNFYSAVRMKEPLQSVGLRFDGRTSFSRHARDGFTGACNACHTAGELQLVAP